MAIPLANLWRSDRERARDLSMTVLASESSVGKGVVLNAVTIALRESEHFEPALASDLVRVVRTLLADRTLARAGARQLSSFLARLGPNGIVAILESDYSDAEAADWLLSSFHGENGAFQELSAEQIEQILGKLLGVSRIEFFGWHFLSKVLTASPARAIDFLIERAKNPPGNLSGFPMPYQPDVTTALRNTGTTSVAVRAVVDEMLRDIRNSWRLVELFSIVTHDDSELCLSTIQDLVAGGSEGELRVAARLAASLEPEVLLAEPLCLAGLIEAAYRIGQRFGDESRRTILQSFVTHPRLSEGYGPASVDVYVAERMIVFIKGAQPGSESQRLFTQILEVAQNEMAQTTAQAVGSLGRA
jgi:hypothetical protein